MVLLILEILMLIGGVVTLVKGEIPRFIFGKASDNFTLESSQARIIGGVMMLPLPVALCGGFAYGAIMFNRGGINTLVTTLFEGLLVIGGIGVAQLLWRTWREEKTDTPTAPESMDAA